MPTKSNNTGGVGGKRPGAGRKPKGVAEKAANGNPGGRKLTVLDIPDTEGSVMPQPDEILSATQKDGTKLKAAEIYERVWNWLDRLGATAYIAPEVIEQYAMCRARWLQCEDMTNELGFLSRHPTTGKPITSPFINIGINYMNQAARQWDAIMQTVNFNCVLHPFGICSKDSNAMKSSNPHSGFYKAVTSRTLDGNGGNPSCNQGGIAVVCVDQGGGKSSVNISEELSPTLATSHGGEPVVAIEGNGSRPSHRGDGYSEDNVSYTLNSVEQHGVAYGLDRAAFNQGRNALYDFTVTEEVEPTMVAKGPCAVAAPTYSSSKASFFTETAEETANTLVATDYKDPPLVNDSDGMEYIVRRLTPTECARLQGFPDWWCSDLGTEHPSDAEIYEWYKIFETYRRITGTSGKPKSDKQIRKFLKDPHSDSAEYKMWGNGVALPCVYFVLSGIAWAAQFSTE